LIKENIGNNVFKMKMKAKSLTLNLMEEEQSVFPIKTFNDQLWHRRLGHFYHAGLMYMQKHNLVRSVPKLENKSTNCATCQYGKQARKPFPQTTWRATYKLQLVHTNVKGLQRIASLNGNIYYIIFIDDNSKFYWIFVLKFKYEVANLF
jgi:hypothetical protein